MTPTVTAISRSKERRETPGPEGSRCSEASTPGPGVSCVHDQPDPKKRAEDPPLRALAPAHPVLSPIDPLRKDYWNRYCELRPT